MKDWPTVVIEVWRGIAVVTAKPKGIRVVIKDHDVIPIEVDVIPASDVVTP